MRTWWIGWDGIGLDSAWYAFSWRFVWDFSWWSDIISEWIFLFLSVRVNMDGDWRFDESILSFFLCFAMLGVCSCSSRAVEGGGQIDLVRSEEGGWWRRRR